MNDSYEDPAPRDIPRDTAGTQRTLTNPGGTLPERKAHDLRSSDETPDPERELFCYAFGEKPVVLL